MNEIKPLCDTNFHEFKTMFYNYFTEDLNIPLTEDQLEKVCSEIKDYADKNIVFTDLLYSNGKASGFINYQIDSSNSTWCEKEGWGFIRELYIDSSLSCKTLGSLLATHGEDRLYKLGVKDIYLTTKDPMGFWATLGYENTGEVSAKNNLPIFNKTY